MLVVAIFILTVHAITNPLYGTVFNGYPFYEERANLVWVNLVRQAPVLFKTRFLPPSSNPGAFLLQSPTRPLLWQYDLGRAARFHSQELIETCPNGAPGSPHNSCDGSDAFTRIAKFYTPGGNAENLNQPPDSQYQYFRVPMHNTRAFVCDGPYEWMESAGTGNSAWPTSNCPGDASAGHRAAIMDPKLLYVGVGVWGRGGNLINAAPQITTQDFAQAAATPYYPNVRICSGAHVFIGSGTGTNMDTMQFFANYFSTSTPTSARVWLQGSFIPMTCEPGWGPSASNCVYATALISTGTACRLYFFEFVDAAGTTRYPEEGAYYTYGEGSCTQDWIPKSQSDPIINGGGPTVPIVTAPVGTLPAGGTTPFVSTAPRTTTGAQVTQTFPPSTAAGSTTAPGSKPVFLFVGAKGARIRIRYLAAFTDFVVNSVFTAKMQLLSNTTAALFVVAPEMVGAEGASQGSVIVDWFVVDQNGVGTAAILLDAFLVRLLGGADVAIGNHIPPIIDATITSRTAVLGVPDSALSLALIVGIAVGGLLKTIVLLVRYLRDRQQSSYVKVGSTAPSNYRFEPVVSKFYGVSEPQEQPLIGEPLLYLARNSRAAAERVHSHRQQNVGNLPAALDLKDKPRGQIQYDFDGSTAPNCLTVFKGEIVVVEDKSSPEWWDVRNANNELGFVPASMVKLLLAEDRPKPMKQQLAPPVQARSPKRATATMTSKTTITTNTSASSSKDTVKPVAAFVNKPVPIPPGKKNKAELTMELLSDFDGREIPNSLSCVLGERVVVLDQTSNDWWDCKNGRGQIGYVPSTFLRAVNDEQVNEVKKSVQQHQQQQQQQQQYQQPQQHQIQQQQQHQQQNLMLKKLSAPVVAMDDNADTVGAIEEFDQDNDTETSEMNVPLLFAAEPVKKFVAPAKPAPAPPSKAAPLAAPIPGTLFRADFNYDPIGGTEIGVVAGDVVVAPVGADLGSDWVFVFNRRTGKKGFVPNSYMTRLK